MSLTIIEAAIIEADAQLSRRVRSAEAEFRQRIRDAEADHKSRVTPLLELQRPFLAARRAADAPPELLTLAEIVPLRPAAASRNRRAIRQAIRRAARRNHAPLLPVTSEGEPSAWPRNWLAAEGIIEGGT